MSREVDGLVTLSINQPDSALQLEKVKGTLGQCIEPGCSRVAKYSICIAGHPVRREGLLGGKAGLCQRCATEERQRWSAFTGELHRETAASAVALFAGSPSERTDAIDALRRLGHSGEEVARAVKAWRAGADAEEILEALGEGQPLAVAA